MILKNVQRIFIFFSSVADPFHFDLDPDADPVPDPGRILTKNQSFEIS